MEPMITSPPLAHGQLQKRLRPDYVGARVSNGTWDSRYCVAGTYTVSGTRADCCSATASCPMPISCSGTYIVYPDGNNVLCFFSDWPCHTNFIYEDSHDQYPLTWLGCVSTTWGESTFTFYRTHPPYPPTTSEISISSTSSQTPTSSSASQTPTSTSSSQPPTSSSSSQTSFQKTPVIIGVVVGVVVALLLVFWVYRLKKKLAQGLQQLELQSPPPPPMDYIYPELEYNTATVQYEQNTAMPSHGPQPGLYLMDPPPCGPSANSPQFSRPGNCDREDHAGVELPAGGSIPAELASAPRDASRPMASPVELGPRWEMPAPK